MKAVASWCVMRVLLPAELDELVGVSISGKPDQDGGRLVKDTFHNQISLRSFMKIKDCSRASAGKVKATSATIFLALMLSAPFSYGQQRLSSLDVDRGRVMLKTIKEDLKKNYYDPRYHGIDLDDRFKTADETLKQAGSLGQIFGIVAKVLLDLDDSHTVFLPPERASRTEYGWQMEMFGDKAYVVAVKPGSDAESKGLKPGDEIHSVGGVHITRQNMWTFQYLYHALRPQPGMLLELIKPDGSQQKLEVLAKVQQLKRFTDLTKGSDIWDLIRESENEDRLHRHRYVELGDDLFIWKMPDFEISNDRLNDLIGKFRNNKALILDLRGNGGGYESALTHLLGNLFDHDVKVGDLKGRKDLPPTIAKTAGHGFSGKLIVLIDSGSGSAAELFARVVQLEKRGIVIGDRSAGAVMRAKLYDHELGADTIIPYGVMITEADIIMTDGKSLEHTGVVPDETKIPTPTDLAARRDPVLAYAMALLGVKISSEKAGEFFPIEWRK
jgi:Periplasmic protease